jgi:hypothetical protein
MFSLKQLATTLFKNEFELIKKENEITKAAVTILQKENELIKVKSNMELLKFKTDLVS